MVCFFPLAETAAKPHNIIAALWIEPETAVKEVSS